MVSTNTKGQPPINRWSDKTPSQIVDDIETMFRFLGGNQPDPVLAVSAPAARLIRRLMRQHERRGMSKRAFYRRRARGQLEWW